MVLLKLKIKLKRLTKATIRCIPLDNKVEEGDVCITGKPSNESVFCKSILNKIFCKKILIEVATFKNSCIFASAMETL